jgi:uncharacterized protein
MFDLDGISWFIAVITALFVGLSKTGIAGLGTLAVALFANILPARESTGALLPLLICADVVAVTAYRKHAVWSYLKKLFPWAAFGIILGFLSMKHIDDVQMQRLIGIILVVMVFVHLWRQRQSSKTDISHNFWFTCIMGILAGFTTMVANAAGPIMILYMLAVGLPKMEFLGTGAWYFFILNVFKVPFSYEQGLIDAQSLQFDLILVPFVLLGAVAGKVLIPYINQSLFEKLALFLTFLAGIRLIL